MRLLKNEEVENFYPLTEEISLFQDSFYPSFLSFDSPLSSSFPLLFPLQAHFSPGQVTERQLFLGPLSPTPVRSLTILFRFTAIAVR